MRAWSTFAEVCGTASASLIGLLFVAVSIRIDLIAPSQELRNRAAQTRSLFGTVLIIAILTAVPGQPIRALGAELTTLAIITAGGLIVLDRRAKAHASTQTIARALELLAPTKIVSITLLVSGALLAFDVRDGRYALIIPVLVALTGGVASAWLFLTKITTEQNAPTRNAPKRDETVVATAQRPTVPSDELQQPTTHVDGLLHP